MRETLILVFSVAILLASFAIGWWGRRGSSSAEAFFGGSKASGPFVVGLATMAAVASAFAVVGVPGAIYKYGNTILLFMLASPGFAFGYLIIGKKIRGMAELGPVASLGDIADLRFGQSRAIKVILAIGLFIGCLMYLAAQIKACSDLFAHLVGWSPFVAGLVIFGILIAYTVASGEAGGILTQAFQGLIMVVAGVAIVVTFLLLGDGFGAVQAVLDGSPQVGERTFAPDFLDAWGDLPGGLVLAWVLLPTLGIMCQPQVLTRMFALKSPLDMPRLCIYVTVANMVVGFMALTVGYAAVYLVASGQVEALADADLAAFVVADELGLVVQLFVYAAVLAASLSTSNLFLTLAGGTIARDLASGFGLTLEPRRQVLVARVCMAGLGIASILVATTTGNMVAVLGTYGFGTLMLATTPPLIIGLLWAQANRQGVLAGSAVALALTLAGVGLDRFGMVWPGGVPWYLVAMAPTVLVTVLVSLATRPEQLDARVRAVIEL